MGWISNLLKKADLNIVHTGLDIVGLTPVIGNLADVANAFLYAGKSQFAATEEERQEALKNATISLTAAIPGAGQFATGAKYGLKGIDAAKVAKVDKTTKKVGKTTTAAKKSLEEAKTAKSKLAADKKIVASPWMEPAKKRLVKGSEKELASKADLLRQARTAQQTARAAKNKAKQKAAEKITLADRYKGAIAKGGKGHKLGGKGIIGKGLNVLIPTERYGEGLGAAPSQTEEKPKSEEEDGEGEGKDKETTPSLLEEGDKEKGKEAEDSKKSIDGGSKGLADSLVEAGNKAAKVGSQAVEDALQKKYDIAAEIDGRMTQDPDYFNKNRGAAQQLFGKARKLGVTADQFNSYVRRNKPAAQERRRDVDRAEAAAWREEKLDQPLYESSRGMPTSAQRGRNIARLLDPYNSRGVTPQQISGVMDREAALQRARAAAKKEKDDKKKK